MAQQSGMPKTTGSMEGFYRSRSLSAPPQRGAMDVIAPVPPVEPPKTTPDARKSPRERRQSSSPRDMIQRQRSSRILESTFSAKVAPVAFVPSPKLSDDADPSMVCTVAYRGMEVIFSTAKTPNPCVFLLCARTRVVLQTLDLPSDGKVVSILSHPSTGMVTVGMSDGTLQTYHPMPTNSKISTDPSTVTSLFGKFRWVNGNVIKCREAFYGDREVKSDIFCHPSLGEQGEAVDISSSADYKVLVAHREQLAVFDATLVKVILNQDSEMIQELPQAELLWTVRLERKIEMAKISGDGRAIAVVVEGEGIENDLPFGVRTFLRDSDDGSSLRSEVLEPLSQQKLGPGVLMRSSSSSNRVGIMYKAGPVLVHPSSVSKVSFRGLGHVNSDVNPDEDEGNDLLLTYCRNDSSVRVFSQNSWKRLIQWNAPPHSRADWVYGLSAFNLGDLESYKRRKTSSAAPSRGNSFDDSSKALNADLLGSRPPTYQGPNTAAGAWIAELTFRNGFPALRLSRLSYMKRSGDEMTPAHFESVAAILPPSSLCSESVLGMGDTGLSVQGIWPAWNPWRSESSADEADGTLSGSAMAFLGLSSTTPSPAVFFGETYQAGTHSPPSEVRVVASHPVSGKVILMEFPLWGDNDFGAMELGSPLRYELSLSEVDGANSTAKVIGTAVGKSQKSITHESVTLDYESSILCGQIDVEGKFVAITWRKPGSMSVLPVAKELERHDSVLSVCSSDSIDSSYSHSNYDVQPESDDVQVFKDLSVVPTPLSLPPLRLPRSVKSIKEEVFVAVKWWSDVTFSGPPHLLAVTSAGSLFMYEISPPWSALEPPMPSDDVFIQSDPSSIAGGDDESMNEIVGESFDEIVVQGDYDVMITPHLDFGIGLRLEAQIDGMPAIAGSFKVHPLNKGQLPAEKTGLIVLGDELVSVNGITLEGISFDDIIGTVRKVGADSPKGSPICMRFRPAIENRRRINSSAFSLTGSQLSDGSSGRRTMEQILGVDLKPQKQQVSGKMVGSPKSALGLDKKDSNAEMGMQQDSCRIVALVPGVLPSMEFKDAMDYQSRIVVLPSHDGRTSTSSQHCGVVLLVVALGSCLYAKRLEMAPDNDPHQAHCRDLGSVDFANVSDVGEKKTVDGKLSIRMVEVVPTDSESPCVIVYHCDGTVRLTFIELSEGNDDCIDFRHFSIFQMDASSPLNKCLIRASSVELLATLSSVGGPAGLVSVWSARPSPTTSLSEGGASEDDGGDAVGQHYVQSILALDACLEDEIVDIRFVPSGSLNAFPWIVAFTHTTAVVHRRDAGSFEWKPVIKLKYPSRPDSSAFHQLSEAPRKYERRIKGTISPADVFPHLIPTLRGLVPVCDERHFLRSDWHPDTILAYACSGGTQGMKTSLQRNVRGVYSWLSRWLHSNENERPTFDPKFPLIVVPLRHFEGHLLMEPRDTGTASDDAQERPIWTVASLTPSETALESEENALLKELQDVLCPSRRTTLPDNQEAEQDERSSCLPEPLLRLNRDELRLLWAIGEILSDPPRFKHLDPAGQLTVFSVALLRALDRAKNQNEKEETKSGGNRTVTRGAYIVKQPSFIERKRTVPIASAGCLSAIVSSSQGSLLESCRVPNEKVDWKTARTLRLPFWIRSDTQLRSVCEEIGQAIFKQTRNILDCALFFIIAGNRRTLRNLAMTDRTTSGTTFSKFIDDQDFSSPRGRKAAEKNAYSLLRKRKYQHAASFFLLAEPPMLKSALEVIVTQIEDLDLAFLVARMIESPQQLGNGGAIGALGISLGGMSGGGYASIGGSDASSSVAADEVPFHEWKPNLQKGAKALIIERGLELALHDPCLKAIQLIWLSRREEASRCLSGLSHDCDSQPCLRSDALFPRAFDLRLDDKDSRSNASNRLHHLRSFPTSTNSVVDFANERVLQKANSVINFVSCPFLVKAMNASVRSRWASTLLVSRALTRRGIDLAATRIILQNTDPLDLEERRSNEQETSGANQPPLQVTAECQGNDASSPIFDYFDSPAIKKSQPLSTVAPASSIFDSFDAPPPKPKPKPSSIFDEFDTARDKKLMPPVTQTASSIFDSFDVAPQKPKPAVSSIFDSFETATQKPQPALIFDSFDPVPQKPEPLALSIFDSFDTAPQKPKAAASSIFDAFDAAPPKRSRAAETPALSKSLVTTSQPTSLDDDSDNDIPDVVPLATPKIWKEWRSYELVQSIARRLLREMASVMSRFQGDTIDAPMKLFRRHFHPLVPSSAGEILNQHCLGDNLIEGLKLCLNDVCSPCDMNKTIVVNEALRILSCPSQPNRAVYAVLLHTLLGRTDQAEDVVRDAATGQIQRCEAIACSNDHLVENRKTSHHMASQYLRRLCARVSWQLEICLWLHQGGALPLSGLVVKEAVIAVRTGLVVASWGRCHECFETMIRCEPDLPMDDVAGRQLWSSLKLIVEPENRTKTTVATGSGGWEFLVDCRRDQSTEMLRNKLPGTFIIRPHASNTGVFTLSFKTNLIPTPSFDEGKGEMEKPPGVAGAENALPKAANARPVKKDDVVQHAIIRLSDVGFRCGSFGPFATLLSLLEAVSASLPFDLLFNKPPTQGIIRDEGGQPSPNSVFLRKLALTSRSANHQWNRDTMDSAMEDSAARCSQAGNCDSEDEGSDSDHDDPSDETAEYSRRKAFGMFSQLLVLSEIRKQLSAVAAAEGDETSVEPSASTDGPYDENRSVDSIGSHSSTDTEDIGVEEACAIASRLVRPLLNWCRLLETGIVSELAPSINELSQKATAASPVDMDASETAIELAPPDVGSSIDGGDSAIRRMIQPESGVEFRTLRAGEGSESAMTVLFKKSAAITWLISSGAEKNRDEALARLARMEKRRVIEPIEISDLGMKTLTSSAENKDQKEQVRYRFVDPWEVEGLESREGETRAAAIGREHYYEFSIGTVASSCEVVLRRMGGLHLLGLWTHVKGGLRFTKALASVYAPWERDAGGDLQMTHGVVSEPSSFLNSIREHLYRNALFRLLKLPQRFLALIQVELLDLKNLTAPGGSPSLTVFALLRLKRPFQGNRLTHKAKALDCVTTHATKIGKSSGPNAAASWGSVARFRFPLPEDVNCDGVSSDGDREALFKGPPSVLQISVYEKKFMSDIFLGAADINLDALTGGGQLEEWVPLRESKLGVTWFARIRLTLRFELMCLGSPSSDAELPPSVGLRRIQELSKQGGAHEDAKTKKSVSTSDLLTYFESMVS